MGLAGATALVTGASSGSGRAIALALSAEGARVWAIARRRPELEELARVAGPGPLEPLGCDITDVTQLARAVRRITLSHQRVDLLVHAAGVFAQAEVGELSVAGLQRVFAVNVVAPHALTFAFLPQLKLARGQVVFLNSSVGLRAHAGLAAYAASKHALRAYADALRADANADGVRVTTLFLGRTATPMQERIHRAEGRIYRPDRLLQPGDVARLVLAIACLPRTCEVTDLVMRPSLPPDADAEV